MTYLKMLEEEIEASEQFTKENFGLQVGNGFPEMVREVVQSEKLSTRLIMGLVIGALSGKELASSMKETPEGQKPEMGKIILKNIITFDVPLALLYWGIQIGRRLERESVALLAELEK